MLGRLGSTQHVKGEGEDDKDDEDDEGGSKGCLSHADLEFVATVATGGRVKFLSAV